MKSAQDIFSSRGSNPIRLQIFQIYKDEVIDLLVQDFSHLSDRIIVKKSGTGKVDVLSYSVAVKNIGELIA